MIYVFVGRFTAFLRAVMPGLAGMSRLPYRRFLLANASGALLWGVGYTLLGYFAGTALNSIERVSGFVGIGILVVVIGVVVALYFAKRRGDAKIQSALDRPRRRRVNERRRVALRRALIRHSLPCWTRSP